MNKNFTFKTNAAVIAFAIQVAKIANNFKVTNIDLPQNIVTVESLFVGDIPEAADRQIAGLAIACGAYGAMDTVWESGKSLLKAGTVLGLAAAGGSVKVSLAATVFTAKAIGAEVKDVYNSEPAKEIIEAGKATLTASKDAVKASWNWLTQSSVASSWKI